MNKFYKLVSAITIPLLMPTYGMLLFFAFPQFSYIPIATRAIITLCTFMLTAFLPFALIYVFKKRGLVSDLYISNRKERPIPFLLIFLFYFTWIFFLWQTVQRLQMPNYILGMSIGIIFSILLLTLISLKWKISAHTSGIGSLTGATFAICFHLAVNPVFSLISLLLISALVALSRVELKAHTPAQAIVGFIAGFTTVFFNTLAF